MILVTLFLGFVGTTQISSQEPAKSFIAEVNSIKAESTKMALKVEPGCSLRRSVDSKLDSLSSGDQMSKDQMKEKK
jgi:hypothetical protein